MPRSQLVVDVGCTLVLLALLVAAAGVYLLDLGHWGTALGLGIAGTKALLIGAIFMDLREGPSLLRIVAAAGAYWGAILLALTLADLLTR